MRNIVGVKGEDRGMRFFFLLFSLPPSLFFMLRTEFRGNSTRERTGPVSSYPYPSRFSRRRAPWLRNVKRHRAGSLLIQILFLLAIGPAEEEVVSPRGSEHAAAVLGQRVAAARPYEAILLILFISLFRDYGQDSRFDNFAGGSFCAKNAFNSLLSTKSDNFLSLVLIPS